MEALKCKICGGGLMLDALNDLFLCEYCGTRFPRVTTREEAPLESPAVVEEEGILPVDKLIQNGRTMLELGDYAKARAFFREATIHYPEDYRGWWYTFVCDAKSMTVCPDKDVLYKTKELEYAFRTAPKEVQPDLLRQYRVFAGQCLRRGCEIEIAKVAGECRKIEGVISIHAAALATRKQKYQEAMKNRGGAVFASILSIAFLVIMFISFVNPSLWMLLTIPLGLFGFLILLGTRWNFSKKEIETRSKTKARLLLLKTIKLVHLKKLNNHIHDLPAMLEKVTIADILNQQKHVA